MKVEKKGIFGGKNKALTLNYDDGNRNDIRFIKTLNAYGIKCTVNLNSGLFAADNISWRLSAEEVKNLYGGHEIALHGYKHLNVRELTEPEIKEEFEADRRGLESLFGTRVRGGAYAYGGYNDTAVKALSDMGICYCRTVLTTGGFEVPKDWLRMESTCHHKSPDLELLTDRFLEYDGEEPAVFSMWGHSYEFENDNNWHILERFCERIANKSDIAYLTGIEVFDYLNNAKK